MKNGMQTSADENGKPGRRCGARKQKRRSGAEAQSSAEERQRGKDRRDGKSKRIGEKHAMTQCINMHKRAKTSINVEVLANDKTYVPHETRTQRNALPCTACGNRGSRKRQNRVSSGSVSGKSGRVWAFAAKLRICLAQSVRNEDGGRIAVRVGWQSGCR